MDAQTALDFIQQHPELSSTKLIVYGQSIGAAVAIHLVSKNPKLISGLIIENTFLSMVSFLFIQLKHLETLMIECPSQRKLIPHVMPPLKALTFMCHQIWDNERTIEELSAKVPVLFLSGSKDELVPPQHMGLLFQTLKSKRPLDETIVFKTFENGSHNDTCMQIGYFEAIQEFWKKFVKKD
jgi:pimeloyl-ACP methyl ester carboxylesterase